MSGIKTTTITAKNGVVELLKQSESDAYGQRT